MALLYIIFKRFFSSSFWRIDNKYFQDAFNYDLRFNACFRGVEQLSKNVRNSREIKYIKYYRKVQASRGTVWYKLFYYPRLVRYSLKTGIILYDNLSIPEGLIIGHAGSIIISPGVVFGGNLMLSHGVTIGRENTGSKAGVPTLGKNVCIKCNVTIIGKITIGDDVLIYPNVFVNYDVPSHSVVINNSSILYPKENATEKYLDRVDK